MTDPIREAFERHIVGDDDRIDYTRTLSRNPATDEYLSCEVEEAWTWYQKGRADLAAWKDAVTDALVIGCIYSDEHDNDPRRAVADLIAWETKIALDPAVSSEARALIERGRADLLAEQQAAEKIPAQPAITDEEIVAMALNYRVIAMEHEDEEPPAVIPYLIMFARALLERKP